MKVINNSNNNFKEKEVSIILISDEDEGEGKEKVKNNKINEASHDYIILSDSSDEENEKNKNYNNDDDDVIFICEKMINEEKNEIFEPLYPLNDSILEDPINQQTPPPPPPPQPSLSSNEEMNKLKSKKILTTKTNNYPRISESSSDILNRLKKRSNTNGDENSSTYDVPSIKLQIKQSSKSNKKIDLETLNLGLNSINNAFDLPSVNSKHQILNLKDFIYKKYFQINPTYSISKHSTFISDQLENLIDTNLESGDLLYMNEMFIFLRNLADSFLLNEINLERFFELFKKIEVIEEATTLNNNSEIILFFYKNFYNLIKTTISVGFNYELLMKNTSQWKDFLINIPILIDKCLSQSNSLMFKVYVLKIKIFTDLMFIYVKFVYEIKMDNFLALNTANAGKKLNWLSFQQMFSISDLETVFVYLNEKFEGIVLNNRQNKP